MDLIDAVRSHVMVLPDLAKFAVVVAAIVGFVVTGLVIDPVVFATDVVDHFGLALGIVVALLAGKWIAAAVGARLFGYTPAARSTMLALILPQVAATPAAAVVAFDTRNGAGQRMLDDTMLNAVLVLMLATSILGPVLAERFAPGLLEGAERDTGQTGA
jgi:Kef-type K+ transport system membrane component KefB